MKKRIPALLLVACLYLGLWAVPAQAEAAPTSDGAIEIWDRAGLDAMTADHDAHYILMADIDMQGVAWEPMVFNGTFDGNGHTLYNLLIFQTSLLAVPSVDGNNIHYDTQYAAFFSHAYGAVIRDLNLLGVTVAIATMEDAATNVFVAGLVGYAESVEITGCSVTGSMYLTSGGKMQGVAGMVGFGYGTLTDCHADVTLVLEDTNQADKCEEFLGGMMATGYLDMQDCTARVRGYASVYGYVHNGGLAGMYYVHTQDRGHAGYIRGCTVDAEIYFFEANPDRRAYCAPVIGEQLHWTLELADNTVENFVNGETWDYSTVLSPHACEPRADGSQAYFTEEVPATCDSFGYKTLTCVDCEEYTFVSDYVGPAHIQGDWMVQTEPRPGQNGLRTRSCLKCGAQTDSEELLAVAGCAFETDSLELAAGSTAQLKAVVTPPDAWDRTVYYSSSDEGVATVNEIGEVTAVGAGQAVITAQAGGVSAQYTVTVPATAPVLLFVALGGGVLAVVTAALLIAGAVRKRRRRRAREARHLYRRP